MLGCGPPWGEGGGPPECGGYLQVRKQRSQQSGVGGRHQGGLQGYAESGAVRVHLHHLRPDGLADSKLAAGLAHEAVPQLCQPRPPCQPAPEPAPPAQGVHSDRRRPVLEGSENAHAGDGSCDQEGDALAPSERSGLHA